MPHNPNIIEQMRERQKRVFRLACDPARYGLTLKAISLDSGVGYDSLRNYAAGETVMSITALDCLVGVIPDELLSLLLGSGRVIVRVPEEIDHDEIAEACQDFLHEKHLSHHPESEAGREIGPGESARLSAKVVRLRA